MRRNSSGDDAQIHTILQQQVPNVGRIRRTHVREQIRFFQHSARLGDAGQNATHQAVGNGRHQRVGSVAEVAQHDQSGINAGGH